MNNDEVLRKLPATDAVKAGFCESIHSRKNMVSYPTLNIPQFDRKGFHTDMHYLFEFKNDPQQMTDNINKFSTTYIWPAHTASLIMFKEPGDTNSFVVYNAENIKYKRNANDWDMNNVRSISNRLIKEHRKTYYAFEFNKMKRFTMYLKIDDRINDYINFAADDNMEAYENKVDEMEGKDTDLKTEDVVLVLKDKNSDGETKASSALLIPIFSKKQKIKSILFLAYGHPAVMYGFNGFNLINMWDTYAFMTALNTIYG
jgi:hypothetical protein